MHNIDILGEFVYPYNNIANPSVAYDQGNNDSQNAGYGFTNVSINDDPRGLYDFNNLGGPNSADGVDVNVTRSAGVGAYPNDSLDPSGAAPAHGLGHGGVNYAAQNAAHGGSHPVNGPSAASGLNSYANRGNGIGSGQYPIDNIGVTGGVYNQGSFTDCAPYAGNVDNGLYRVDNISAYSALHDQGNFAGAIPYAGNVYHGLFPVDYLNASNAVYDQGNPAGLAPYAGNVDHGLYSVDSMATPSAVRRANNSTGFDPNAANIHDGLLPFTHRNGTGVACDGANHGMEDPGFSTQAPGLTPTVDSIVSPSTASGSVMEVRGRPRPRPAGVDRRGRPRWACDRCAKTFGRLSDLHRHAKKHSGALPFRCNVTGCTYPGSYHQDKLEQHKVNCQWQGWRACGRKREGAYLGCTSVIRDVIIVWFFGWDTGIQGEWEKMEDLEIFIHSVLRACQSFMLQCTPSSFSDKVYKILPVFRA
ncbi:MAG: hypothetical protein ALECFALPRED_001491 [Alectoria fallacina]|uniref:C2H2-type domain-containing protein n=1 Tax=Alectoria fallacina TaxID=1903189 RepID=A0A8H3FB37_9LECA|nr:MAG: hypothetical protein ALECFALPRED_001491 [Alectoria fallacina]